MDKYRNIESDGCTGVSRIYRFVTGKRIPFLDCCWERDYEYYGGGLASERKEADRRLYLCIKAQGYPVAAALFYCAVRVFGWRFWRYDD